MVNEFYKISWIVETIADQKFKVVSKNKYFTRKYKLTSNAYRKWCFWYVYEFERSDEKKKQREKITVSLEKLKCAKTDSPTCKLYWLIVKYKIYSGLQAGKFQYNKLFICKSSNAYIEHLSLWSTRSAALPHVKLMIIVNSLGFDNWGYSSKSWKFSAT